MTPRVSVVTGASSGIGRAMAVGLARRGDLVVGVGRDPGRLDNLQAALAEAGPAAHRVLGLDVGREEDMGMLARTLEDLGRVDLLVASAARGQGGDAALPRATKDLPLAEWQAMLDVNLHGVFLADMAVIPLMRSRGAGTIVNVSSALTPRGQRGTALAPAYSATKFALTALGRQLGAELAEDGIKVVTVFPGTVDTPLISGTLLHLPFGGSMGADSFAEAMLRLLQVGDDAWLPEPHLLPVPQRRIDRSKEKA